MKILAVVGHAKRLKVIGLVSADAGRLSNSSAFAQTGVRRNGNTFRAPVRASTMRGNFPFSACLPLWASFFSTLHLLLPLPAFLLNTVRRLSCSPTFLPR